MTHTDTAHTAHDSGHGTGHGADHGAHPTEKQYWMVFVMLVALTAVEVAWSFMGAEGPALVIPLLVMMTVKFFLVAGAFMHLYFDLKLLNGRMFTWAFFGAILLAGAVYAAVIASFRFNI